MTRTADDHTAGSLRNAIDQANALGPNSPWGVIIRVPAGTFSLTRCPAGGDDDSNATGDLDYTHGGRVELRADTGAEIRQTCPGTRAIDVRSAAPVRLTNITVTSSGIGKISQGGGMRSNGAVHVVGGASGGGSADFTRARRRSSAANVFVFLKTNRPHVTLVGPRLPTEWIRISRQPQHLAPTRQGVDEDAAGRSCAIRLAHHSCVVLVSTGEPWGGRGDAHLRAMAR